MTIEKKRLPASTRRELVLSELKRKNSIRTLFRNVPPDEIGAIIERLQGVREEVMMAQRAEKPQRDKYHKELLSQAIKGGLEPKQIEALLLKRESSQYYKDGRFWSGKGRRPVPFSGLSLKELESYRVRLK